ncbi:MAG: MerR family transcriptional regulator [Sphingobacteriales bacterium]|nr:MerR family transcriptional regulator [Sphingobacteriales bacterium]
MDITEIKLDKLTGKSLEELVKSNHRELGELFINLMQRQFTISDSMVEHRTILHWEKEQIIVIDNNQRKGWRRFSFFDYVWIKIISELRAFGVSLPTIRSVKEELFSPAEGGLMVMINSEQHSTTRKQFEEDNPGLLDEAEKLFSEESTNEENQITWFHFLILSIIYDREPTFLLFFSDGHYSVSFLKPPKLEKKIEHLLETIETKNTLLINITKIIDNFFLGEKFTGNTYYDLSPLSRKEKEIIEIIRSGGIKSVHINLKDGEEYYVEILRKKPATNVLDEIQNIIAKNKFSRITLDTENGRVAYINETEKRIIK